MRRLIASLILLLSATLAAAQVPFPQTLPANTVYGRLGVSPGPGQAIPFGTFTNTIITGIYGFTANGDSDFTIPSSAHTVATSAALTAARTWTLPAVSAIAAGQQVCVIDRAGGITSTNTLTVQRSGSDTISGGTNVALKSAFSGACFLSDGASKYTASTWALSSTIVTVRVVTAAGAVTVTTADTLVVVNKTVGAATVVNLPASPVTGQTYTIKDGKGDAATNNITVTPAVGNIDGAATFVISSNFGAIAVIYNGTQWNVL